MQYTEQQLSEFKDEFARRRKRQLLATIPVVALFVLVITVQEKPDLSLFGLSAQVLVGAAFAVVLGVVGFSLWNWRCPACNRYLGKGINPSFCSKCGAPLQ